MLAVKLSPNDPPAWFQQTPDTASWVSVGNPNRAPDLVVLASSYYVLGVTDQPNPSNQAPDRSLRLDPNEALQWTAAWFDGTHWCQAWRRLNDDQPELTYGWRRAPVVPDSALTGDTFALAAAWQTQLFSHQDAPQSRGRAGQLIGAMGLATVITIATWALLADTREVTSRPAHPGWQALHSLPDETRGQVNQISFSYNPAVTTNVRTASSISLPGWTQSDDRTWSFSHD